MKIQPFKRLISSDYDKEYQALITKLGGALNVFNDDLYNALTNNLSIDDNFNQVKKQLTVSVNATGAPLTTLSFKSGLSANCYGTVVVSATNTSSPTSYPTSQPFISFSQNSGIITVNNITGLQANNIYNLNIIVF